MVVGPELTNDSKCWTMHEKLGRDLATAAMKAYRMFVGVTTLDQQIQIVNTRVWFAEVRSQDKSNVDIFQVCERGR